MEIEAKKRLRDENADVPVTPREWQSDTAELTAAEIEGMTIKAKRLLMKQTFRKKTGALGAPAHYQPFADRVLSLKTPKVSLQSSALATSSFVKQLPNALICTPLRTRKLSNPFQRSTQCRCFRAIAYRTHVVQDSHCIDVKQELDFGVQAVPSVTDAWSQAEGDAMKNVEIQHDSNDLTVKKPCVGAGSHSLATLSILNANEANMKKLEKSCALLAVIR